jgi:hypothetical protein
MVTDGLEVTLMSAISSTTLINKFSVGNDVELAEKYVSVGMDEGLGLLRAALSSDTYGALRRVPGEEEVKASAAPCSSELFSSAFSLLIFASTRPFCYSVLCADTICPCLSQAKSG